MKPGTTLPEPALQLIDALAEILAEDYLREQAANDAAPAGADENPVLRKRQDAA